MQKKKSKALLVSVKLPDETEEEHQSSLAELGRLCHTLGFKVIGQLTQSRPSLAPGTVVGEGKLAEIVAHTENAEKSEELPAAELADIVVFDNDITPSQMQNLEKATGVEILDRTGVIIEIFNRHAQTREAKLQVEIAKLKYSAPRLRLSNVGADRQGGGIGAKGAGESAHELDKRRIRDRISELKHELKEISKDEATRRMRRKDSSRIALVGYTNAGKSSLMRTLTGSEVLVADKLFATLDTTVRAMHPPTTPRILISDTVGFIKKLPHDLVASFRSTLDEATHATLLLLVVDASDTTFRARMQVTQTVLQEIGSINQPLLLVLNKIDLVDDAQKAALKREFPDALMLSTLNPKDVQKLREIIIKHVEKDMQDFTLVVPYTRSHVIGDVRSLTHVLNETHDEVGTTFTLRTHEEIFMKLQKAIDLKLGRKRSRA